MKKLTTHRRLCRHVIALALPLLAAATLSACTFDRTYFLQTQREVEDDTPFTAVSRGQAWINAPGMMLVMQRGLLNGSEQRIGLQNDVPVTGDNMVILRSRNGAFGNGRLRFEEFMARVGGTPAPFAALKPGELRSGEDSLGSYLWAEHLAGGDVTCVLGIRRITQDMRALPGQATAMDILLRNCIHGTAQEALIPLLDASVGVRLTAGDGQGSTLMLSPLAAPGVE